MNKWIGIPVLLLGSLSALWAFDSLKRLDADPQKLELASATLGKSVVPVLETSCCVCMRKEGEAFLLEPNAVAGYCDSLSKSNHASCVALKVKGSQCSFIPLTRSGHQTCTIKPLEYVEDGVEKTLKPSDEYVNPCVARTLLSNETQPVARTQDNTRNSKPSESAEPQVNDCRVQVKQICKDVEPSGGKLKDCIAEHKKELDPQCQALYFSRET